MMYLLMMWDQYITVRRVRHGLQGHRGGLRGVSGLYLAYRGVLARQGGLRESLGGFKGSLWGSSDSHSWGSQEDEMKEVFKVGSLCDL